MAYACLTCKGTTVLQANGCIICASHDIGAQAQQSTLQQEPVTYSCQGNMTSWDYGLGLHTVAANHPEYYSHGTADAGVTE